MFVDIEYGYYKVAGRSIYRLFSAVVSTLTTWSSKHQTVVQTSTFGAGFISLKKAVKESVMIWYHLISTRIKFSRPTDGYSHQDSI